MVLTGVRSKHTPKPWMVCAFQCGRLRTVCIVSQEKKATKKENLPGACSKEQPRRAMLLQLRSQALTQDSTDCCGFAASTITYPLPQLRSREAAFCPPHPWRSSLWCTGILGTRQPQLTESCWSFHWDTASSLLVILLPSVCVWGGGGHETTVVGYISGKLKQGS